MLEMHISCKYVPVVCNAMCVDLVYLFKSGKRSVSEDVGLAKIKLLTRLDPAAGSHLRRRHPSAQTERVGVDSKAADPETCGPQCSLAGVQRSG
jgi:hypothetical protein